MPACPSSGSAWAMASVVVPVNMPTSRTVFAPVSLHSVAMSCPSRAPAQHSFFCRNRVLPCTAGRTLLESRLPKHVTHSCTPVEHPPLMARCHEVRHLLMQLLPGVAEGLLYQLLAHLHGRQHRHKPSCEPR